MIQICCIQRNISSNMQTEFLRRGHSPKASEPLLPNYGVGRIRHYNLDLDMMTMLNSKERRLPDFIKLLVVFVKLWDFGESGLVEYKLASHGPTPKTPVDNYKKRARNGLAQQLKFI